MQLAHGERTGLVTRAQIAERAGVKRPAVSNWARRHGDFPVPVRSGDTELFREAEVARWLANRTVPASQRLDGERVGTTYADRFLRSSADHPAAEPEDAEGARPVGSEDEKIVGRLMGRLADRVRGPAPMADYVNLCLTVMYVRHAEPARWRRIEDALSAGQGGRDVPALLRTLGGMAQEALRRNGDHTDMRGSLLQLEPRSWDDLVLAVRTAAGTGAGAFQLVWESFSAREGLQSAEYCSPVGLASLAAELVLTPGQEVRVLDPYARGGEMLAAAYRRIGSSPDAMYGETLDGRMQAVASLYLLHFGVRPQLTSTRSDRWPPDREHSADVVLTNPPFNMSDVPDSGRRTGHWPYGAPPQGNDNLAWVQYVLGALVPGGRAVVVMPVKAGNSVNTAERRIRRALVCCGAVECVITLPSHLFSATPVPVSLWLIRRVERPVRGDILFVDAQEAGMKVRRRRVLRDMDREAITALVRPWLDGKQLPDGEEYAALATDRGLSAVVVSREVVAEDVCSLLPAHHLRGGSYGLAPDWSRLHAAVEDEAEQESGLRLLERGSAAADHRYGPGRGPAGWRETDLRELCEVQPGPSYTRLPAEVRTADAGVPLVFPQDLIEGRIADEPRNRVPWRTAERFAKFELLPDDIVCVRTGAQQQPALVSRRQAGWLLSSNVMRLRVKPDAGVDPLYLHAYLSLRYAREWMAHRAAATAAPSLSSEALRHLPVRLPPPGQQRRSVELLGELDRRTAAHASYVAALGRLRTELTEHLLHGSVEPL
ncbi:N-6 DNA methylase [Streptomyces sp. SID8352]|uniref:N-6 DNA methylase n=1 Tax=Streptomyces sp. SID8352 TaxID=2690338 RepID=UPI00136A4DD2|nr:N-6 DNA methylase [Streptomyces sp. SID8352]MYU23764.1 N-6 DNA methylase [Streptomyces sp. SID8352]